MQFFKKTIRLFPISLGAFALAWIGTSGVLVWILNHEESAVNPGPGSRVESVDVYPPEGETRKKRLLLAISGRGRGRNWDPEEIRRFYYVQELTYRSTVTEKTKNEIREKRTIERLRFLLFSLPPDERKITFKPDVTALADQLGEKTNIRRYGRGGIPISPPAPSEVSPGMMKKLSSFFRGPTDPKSQKNPYRVLSYTSPHEGSVFQLRHPISHNIDGRPKLTKEREHFSEFEKRIILAAPFAPEKTLRETRYVQNPPSKTVHYIHGNYLNQYTVPLFGARARGTLVMREQSNGKHPKRLAGNGSFNLVHPQTNRQTGELRVTQTELHLETDSHQVRRLQLKGSLLLYTLPSGHILDRVRFLEEPNFRIKYSKAEN